MKTTIIGLAAKKRAGKGTLCGAAKKRFGKESVLVLSSRELLGQCLDYWNIPRDRENLQDLFIILSKRFGADIQ